MIRTSALAPYLARRVLRIYPAFNVSYLLTAFALGPLVHAQPMTALAGTFGRLVMLMPPPAYPGQLPGVRFYPLLNGAMWTIAIEFRCYLLIALLWSIGLLSKRRVVLAMAAAALALSVIATATPVHTRLINAGSYSAIVAIFGQPVGLPRLFAAFLIGSSFYLYREVLIERVSAPLAGAAVVVAAGFMLSSIHFAEAGLMTFGAVALFWLSFKANLGLMQTVNDRWDISYGVYLYGWPLATYIRYLDPEVSAWELALQALSLAYIFATVSWLLVEKPTKDLGRSGCLVGQPARAGS